MPAVGNAMYLVSPDDRVDFGIRGHRKWGLPGIQCDVCGAAWANVGLSYPTADLGALKEPRQFERRWPVSMDVFSERRDEIARAFPWTGLLRPGTDLGPLVADHVDETAPVAWLDSWTLFVGQEVRDVVAPAMASQRMAPAVSPKGDKLKLLELELPAVGRLSSSLPDARESRGCRACGRASLVKPTHPSLDRATLPSNLDLFRLEDLTTLIVCSARWRKTMEPYGKGLMQFREVAAL